MMFYIALNILRKLVDYNKSEKYYLDSMNTNSLQIYQGIIFNKLFEFAINLNLVPLFPELPLLYLTFGCGYLINLAKPFYSSPIISAISLSTFPSSAKA